MTPVNFSFSFLLCFFPAFFMSYSSHFSLFIYSFLSCRSQFYFAVPQYSRDLRRTGRGAGVMYPVWFVVYGLDGLIIGFDFFGGCRYFYLRCGICSIWGFLLDSYPVGALDFHLWARNLPLSFSLERPTCLCNRCRRGGGVSRYKSPGPGGPEAGPEPKYVEYV